MADRTHYEAVLMDLIAQRNEIDMTIASLKRQLGLLTSPPNGTNSASIQSPQAKPYKAVTIRVGALSYLDSVREFEPCNVIAKALEDGGFEHASKSFPNTVRAALARDPAFVQHGSLWGLKVWGEQAKQGAA